MLIDFEYSSLLTATKPPSSNPNGLGGGSSFLTILTYKVEETGKKIVEVEARNTSQICSDCGEKRKEKLKLSQRVFKCSHCDYQENRDINAARNVLNRAKRVRN